MSDTVENKVNTQRGLSRTREGVVVSDKMDKTVTVAVTRLVKHPVVGKYIKRTQKYLAHDESNECKAGDIVRIVQSRPLSRRKHWRVREVVSKAPESYRQSVIE